MALTHAFAPPERLWDPDDMQPRGQVNPCGIRFVPAMFVGDVTPAIIVAAAPPPSACAISIGE